jgi:hypothetical protein
LKNDNHVEFHFDVRGSDFFLAEEDSSVCLIGKKPCDEIRSKGNDQERHGDVQGATIYGE